MDDVASPCTGICRLDLVGETCLGCRRTLDEIAAWSTLSSEGRRAVLARLALASGDAGRR